MEEQQVDKGKMRDIRNVVMIFKDREGYTQEDLEKHLNNIGKKDLTIKPELDDHIYAYHAFERRNKYIPAIISELSKVLPVMGFDDDGTQEKKNKTIDEVSTEIARLAEDAGVLYAEVDSIIDEVSGFLANVLTEAKNRTINMTTTSIAMTIEEKFGKNATVAQLAEYHKQEIAKKVEKQKQIQKEEAEKSKQVDAEAVEEAPKEAESVPEVVPETAPTDSEKSGAVEKPVETVDKSD